MRLPNHTGENCLRLEASSIGSKAGNINGNVFDDEAKKFLKQSPGTEFMSTQIENHLLERYPTVFMEP